MTSQGGTGSIGLHCVDVAVHCAGARTAYYDEDPVRTKAAEQLGAEARDVHGKREKGFHPVDATVRITASPETLDHLADAVRALTARFTGHLRRPADVPEADELPGGVHMYSPATGSGSPPPKPNQLDRVNRGQPVADGFADGAASSVAAQEARSRRPSSEGEPGSAV
ncbi:hypothetical protein [Streptomyces sp. NPDC008122]|uniref:hypothetical protein n=1 Tax=Streptomyces sp. NPDC008122 TaxID=3364810 RepID=UPI0036F15B81